MDIFSLWELTDVRQEIKRQPGDNKNIIFIKIESYLSFPFEFQIFDLWSSR